MARRLLACRGWLVQLETGCALAGSKRPGGSGFFPFDPKNHSWVMVQFWMIFLGTVILGNFMKIPPGLQPFFGWDRT